MSESLNFKVDPSSLASILVEAPFRRPKDPGSRKKELRATRILPNRFGYSENKKKRHPSPRVRSSLSERKAPPDFKPKLFSKTRRELNFKQSLQIPENRESLSGVFRQSLSLNELKGIYEDDSTGSFESLESRLKTPGRPKNPPRKSLSAGDLSKLAPSPSSAALNKNVPSYSISKSSSALSPQSCPQWLAQAQNTLNEVRAENIILSEQLAVLDNKIRERRTRFKNAWGVSPKNINKTRTYSKPQETPLSLPSINVNIPIRVHEQSGNMSIAHNSSSSLSFRSPERFDISAPTPMALRHLSQRVKLELASLYDS